VGVWSVVIFNGDGTRGEKNGAGGVGGKEVQPTFAQFLYMLTIDFLSQVNNAVCSSCYIASNV
jgi:hypothetical protein